ncbi:MAG: histidine phosphatase family protein [Eubacterium sp.]
MKELTTLYLIRHGTTDNNASGHFQGSLNSPLNSLGFKQAKYLGKRFETIELDAIYTSPLIRARQTAEGLKGNKNLPLIPLDGVVEVDGGKLEGRTIAENDNDFPGLIDQFKYDLPNFSAPDGESTRQVYDRVVDALTQIADENPDKTIACVSHGFAIQTFLCYAQGTAFEDMKQKILRNTAVSKFIFDEDGTIHIEYIGDDNHLPDDMKCEQPAAFRIEE